MAITAPTRNRMELERVHVGSNPTLSVFRIIIFIVLLLLAPVQTFAAAFQLWEESAEGVGDYHAGAAARGDDASDIFYNPALMSRFDKPEVSFGAVLVAAGINFSGNVYGPGSYPSGTPAYANDVPGDTNNIVPNFHIVWPLSSHWAIGFEETTPFGLSTEYPTTTFDAADPNTYTGLLATETQLQTVNLNPSVSYAFNNIISVGAGFDALHGEAIYDDTLYYANITNELSGWAYGYNAGILAQFSKHTRLGLSYRSAMTIDGAGPSALTLGTQTTSSTVSAQFPLPATTMLSLYQDITHRLALMASVFYTQWSCFDVLTMHNIAYSPSPITLATNENYRNTWNESIGALYYITRTIGIETGFGHDETPTQYDYRDIRLPDNNHYAASLGFIIKPSDRFRWTMGWTHFFINPSQVNNSLSYNASQSVGVSLPPAVGIGSVDADVNVFGMQITFVL